MEEGLGKSLDSIFKKAPKGQAPPRQQSPLGQWHQALSSIRELGCLLDDVCG